MSVVNDAARPLYFWNGEESHIRNIQNERHLCQRAHGRDDGFAQFASEGCDQTVEQLCLGKIRNHVRRAASLDDADVHCARTNVRIMGQRHST